MRAISRGRGRREYTLRIPISLSPNAEIRGSSDVPARVILGRHAATLEPDGDRHLITVRGFTSEAAAKRYALRIGAALLFLAIDKRIGIRFSVNPKHPAAGEFCIPDGLPGAQQLGWKARHTLYHIDGVIHTHETTIVPEHRKIVTSGVIAVRPVTFLNVDDLRGAFEASRRVLSPGGVFQDKKLILALEAFATAYYAQVPLMTYLSFVTALEILAFRKKSHPQIVAAVEHLGTVAKTAQRKSRSPRARARFASLLNRLNELKRVSIQEAMCDLVQAGIGQPRDPWLADRTAVEKTVKDIYNVRSQLTHSGSGKVDPGRFADCYHKLEAIAAKLLARRLRSPRKAG